MKNTGKQHATLPPGVTDLGEVLRLMFLQITAFRAVVTPCWSKHFSLNIIALPAVLNQKCLCVKTAWNKTI